MAFLTELYACIVVSRETWADVGCWRRTSEVGDIAGEAGGWGASCAFTAVMARRAQTYS